MSAAIRSILILCLAAASILRAADEDYAAKYQALRDKKAADAEVEALLTEWRTKNADNPEAWVASANYYFNKRAVQLSGSKPGKGDIPLKKEDTGEEGSISFPLDPENVKRAADLLEEATRKFSDRLDIWCGLAFVYQESENFDAEFPVLQKMVAYAKAHPANLLWMGDKISDPPDKFIPEKLHGYAIYYEKKETEDDDKRFLKIAQFSAEQYPNHPYALNDVALYYSVAGDNAKTREWLEKAHKADPKDTLVLVNLGQVSSDMNDLDAAKKYYEEAIKVDPKGEQAEEAREALAELKKAKK
jgi:tetratricopeptide (TPR) repeat protein